MTAVTAITAQNTTGVLSINSIPAKEISRQIDFTSKDADLEDVFIQLVNNG